MQLLIHLNDTYFLSFDHHDLSYIYPCCKHTLLSSFQAPTCRYSNCDYALTKFLSFHVFEREDRRQRRTCISHSYNTPKWKNKRKRQPKQLQINSLITYIQQPSTITQIIHTTERTMRENLCTRHLNLSCKQSKERRVPWHNIIFLHTINKKLFSLVTRLSGLFAFSWLDIINGVKLYCEWC